MVVFLFIFFFFSSRRRHTRSKRDWSSDVCSSDLYGMSCDLCSSAFSKNERLVSIILTKINENYITQKEFSNCRIKQPLPFDFYLPQYNMVIETHGAQHYEEVK